QGMPKGCPFGSCSRPSGACANRTQQKSGKVGMVARFGVGVTRSAPRSAARRRRGPRCLSLRRRAMMAMAIGIAVSLGLAVSLARFSLACFGFARLSLAWFGLACFGLACFGLARLVLAAWPASPARFLARPPFPRLVGVVGCVGREFDFGSGNALSDQLLDRGDRFLIERGDDGNRGAGAAGPPGAADAMDIIIGVMRHVEIEDM